ncbi:MAG: Flp pilus assembly complex ATPase component TadA [Candidatus Marinimicrobia bacterium]|nr:Flp pilus assembly complex ATPase component TadA [Candidatus Neomarinimicrobiota bacterium]
MNPRYHEAKAIIESVKRFIPEETIFDIEYCKNIYMAVKNLDKEKLMVLRDLVKDFLYVMEEKEASDIDLGGFGTKGLVWFRVQGNKAPEETLGNFTMQEFDILLLSLLEDKQAELFFINRNFDFSFILPGREGESRRLRASMYLDMGHVALNMRMIDATIRALHSYGFHPYIMKKLSLEHTKSGLTLVTGITGSGKSTTLDAIIDFNNKQIESHITIIADPIERVHHSHTSLVRHREVGSDVLSFKAGAIQALRQDPDIIMIGEMRDPETIMVTLELTDTGHKVYSTLHTSSAVETIDRIIGEVPKESQVQVKNRLADVLDVIISQKLVPAVNGKLVLAKEVLAMNTAIRAAIKNNNLHEIYGIMRQEGKSGMMTLEQDLKRLFRANIISFDTAMANANEKKTFNDMVKYSF